MYSYDIPTKLGVSPSQDNRGAMTVFYEGDLSSHLIFKMTNSHRGVLRGFHWQRGRSTQSKLITVISGKILDVCIQVVDENLTGNVFVNELVAGEQIFVPEDFAHAYLCIHDDTVVTYLCEGKYENEISFNPLWAWPFWPISEEDLIISQKDLLR